MPTYTERVQVLLSLEQVTRLRAIAQTQDESMGALIRKALEDVYLRPEQAARLDAVQRMAALSLPVSDWEQMERESIE
ncbi:MAG: hypothetical protein ACJ8CR_37910 [Roseiflexaceae bacterium]